MKWAKSLLLSAGLLVSACTQERPASVSAPQTGPALWAVKDADTTVYLFGTVHVLPDGVEWFRGAPKAAFDKSDELVLEIIEPENQAEMAQIMGAKAIAIDGVRLSDRLTAEQRTKYQAAMSANGLPWQAFETFSPWLPGIMLAVAPLEKLGYRGDLGAEKTLTRAAKASAKRIGALETAEQQLGFFSGLPVAQQLAFLNSTVDGLPEMEQEFGALVTHWRNGDPDKLAEQMNEAMEATPELADTLLYQRNARWAQWIKTRLEQPGTVFVAVGAGHLAGKNSVQDKLRDLGIASARVTK